MAKKGWQWCLMGNHMFSNYKALDSSPAQKTSKEKKTLNETEQVGAGSVHAYYLSTCEAEVEGLPGARVQPKQGGGGCRDNCNHTL